MAGYVAHIPEWFVPRRAAQVAAFFAATAGGSINVLKLTKLIYLADRRSMEKRDFPITGDNLVSMPFGPVNTYTYSLINGCADRGGEVFREYIRPRVDRNPTLYLAKTLEEEDHDELSESDLAIMTETWEEFKDIDRFELAEWTHRFCPEWRDPRGSSIPIEFATVFKRLNKDDPIDLAEMIQADRTMHLVLTSDNAGEMLEG